MKRIQLVIPLASFCPFTQSTYAKGAAVTHLIGKSEKNKCLDMLSLRPPFFSVSSFRSITCEFDTLFLFLYLYRSSLSSESSTVFIHTFVTLWFLDRLSFVIARIKIVSWDPIFLTYRAPFNYFAAFGPCMFLSHLISKTKASWECFNAFFWFGIWGYFSDFLYTSRTWISNLIVAHNSFYLPK